MKSARGKPCRTRQRRGQSNTLRAAKGPRFGPRQLRLLRRTFARLEQQTGITGLAFYRNLFNLDPALRPLFQTSIDRQARKLMESLAYTIATLEDPEALIPVLHSLGRRHATYGVRDQHYDTVVEALLATFAGTLGPAFSREARLALEQALGFVARVMKEGAAQTSLLKS